MRSPTVGCRACARLGEIRAATITYRAIVRSHLLATTELGKQAQEVLLAKWIDYSGCGPQDAMSR